MASHAIVGVSDHAGWAVLMTVGPHHALLDRRRVALIDEGLPCLPHHHEAQGKPEAEGVALVKRVQQSAEKHAATCLDALAKSLSGEIGEIALRTLPKLPDTIAGRIASYHAQTRADGVMYREAVAKAARDRGWAVYWFDAKTVFTDAERTFKRGPIEELFKQTKAQLGPPWQKDHKLAMAAAIAAGA
ncbi:MAG: hypothetical protein KDB90_03205 [Planctomycetes bacterium]|nr:hypothetical protein [Planctomycetota bacterium]